MAEPAQSLEETYRPDISHLITEDDEPVDNWFQERQQRLLPDSLYACWSGDEQREPFLAAADVGLFHKVSDQAVVPDVMVSLGVRVPEDWWEDHNRSYMIWEFGKAPDIVVEVVSNRKGKEDEKLKKYASAGVPYAVIFDPRGYQVQHLESSSPPDFPDHLVGTHAASVTYSRYAPSDGASPAERPKSLAGTNFQDVAPGKRPLRVYVLHARRYVEVADPSWLEDIGLGLTLWEGAFEGLSATWLRWCDRDGNVLPTGLELANQEKERADQERGRAEQERDRADQERDRADQERDRAEQERDRAERLAARLRELGEDVD